VPRIHILKETMLHLSGLYRARDCIAAPTPAKNGNDNKEGEMGLVQFLRNAGYAAFHPALMRSIFVFSHLTNAERLRLYELAKGARTVLEIGSYLGASACCFAARLKKQGSGQVFCIDTWTNDAMSEGHRDTFVEFMRNVRPFKLFVVPVRGYSTEVVPDVRRFTSRLDVLFVDGDHSYIGAKADWEAYKCLLRGGSVVIFHDSGWAEGVQRVVREEVMPLAEDVGQLPNMWWATIRKDARL
jgi:Methyltransferase domain